MKNDLIKLSALALLTLCMAFACNLQNLTYTTADGQSVSVGTGQVETDSGK